MANVVDTLVIGGRLPVVRCGRHRTRRIVCALLDRRPPGAGQRQPHVRVAVQLSPGRLDHGPSGGPVLGPWIWRPRRRLGRPGVQRPELPRTVTRAGHQPSQVRLRRAAGGLIGACAAYQVLLGAYFVVWRPPLLPEDLRFLGASANRLVEVLPRLETWLDLVFAVLGGQMAALGVLVAGFALRLVRTRGLQGYELVLLGLAGTMSVGAMSAVNFVLASNFRWFLVLPVLAWAAGVALAIRGGGQAPADAKARA